MKYENQNLEDQAVAVDGNSYTYCMFKNCCLEYRGGEHPEFFECTFISSPWALVGPAGRTLEFLRDQWTQGEERGRQVVANVMKFITGSDPGGQDRPE